MLTTRKQILTHINDLLGKQSIPSMNASTLDVIVLDVSRILDKKVATRLRVIKRDLHLSLNTAQRNIVRDILLGYPCQDHDEYVPYRLRPDHHELSEGYAHVIHGIHEHPRAVFQTIIARYQRSYLHVDSHVNEKYQGYIQRLQKDKYQLIYLNVDARDGWTSQDINDYVHRHYNELSNYHDLVITFRDTKDEKIKWSMIAQVAIYLENFLLENNFPAFQKRNRHPRIQEMQTFLHDNPNIQDSSGLRDIVRSFYQGVSYGFHFVDLFISSDGSTKSLVMQKVQFNPAPVRCPACYQLSSRSNSYPKLLLKSFECQNPACPERSKSGRGKRFDLLNAKAQTMLKRNDPNDRIDDDLYRATHRDIVDKDVLNMYTMIRLYTWSGDHVLSVNANGASQYQGRNITHAHLEHRQQDDGFDNLLLVRFLRRVYEHINVHKHLYDDHVQIGSKTLLFHGDSNDLGVSRLSRLDIGAAITSPPYYNAREYSQWKNFLCYLIDMMIDAKTVQQNLKDGSAYIYNVGDIVDQDNVYVDSHMSRSRLMLGFYSALIFHVVGFHLVNDIIWDKGEVQSHRNSSPNHFSGYLKPVNSYEHDLVFYKGDFHENPELLADRVVDITPVRKIDSHGKNTYGHTAPFPPAIASLILPFAPSDRYILDPFMGSGTTNQVAREHGYRSIGFELNRDYYDLTVQRLKK